MWNNHSYTLNNYNYADAPAYPGELNSHQFTGGEPGSFNGPSVSSSNYYSNNSFPVGQDLNSDNTSFNNSETYSNNQNFPPTTYHFPPPTRPVHYTDESKPISYNHLQCPIGHPPVSQHSLEPPNNFYNLPNSYSDDSSQYQAGQVPSYPYFNANKPLLASSHSAAQYCKPNLPQISFDRSSDDNYFPCREKANIAKTNNFSKQEKKKFCSASNLIVIKESVEDVNKFKSYSTKTIPPLSTSTSNCIENDCSNGPKMSEFTSQETLSNNIVSKGKVPTVIKSSSPRHNSSKIIENVHKTELSICYDEGARVGELEVAHSNPKLSLSSSYNSDRLGEDIARKCSVTSQPSFTTSKCTNQIMGPCNSGVISSTSATQNCLEELRINKPDSLNYTEVVAPSWTCNVPPRSSVNFLHRPNAEQHLSDLGYVNNYNLPINNLEHCPSTFFSSYESESMRTSAFNNVENFVADRTIPLLNDQLGLTIAHKNFDAQSKYCINKNNNKHLISEELNFISKNNRILNEQYLKVKDSRYYKRNCGEKDVRNSEKNSKFSSSKSLSDRKINSGLKELQKGLRSKGSISPRRDRTSKFSSYSSQDIYKHSKKGPENEFKSFAQTTKGIKRKTRSPSSSRSDIKYPKFNDNSNIDDHKFKLGSKESKIVKNTNAKELEDSSQQNNERKHDDEVGEVNDNDSDATPWIRSSPADLYYQRDPKNPAVITATKKLQQLCEKFESKLVQRSHMAREKLTKERDEKNMTELSLLNQKDTPTGTVCISAKKPMVVEDTEKSTVNQQDSISLKINSCSNSCDTRKSPSECCSSNEVSNNKVFKSKKIERSCVKSSKSSVSKCKSKCGKLNSHGWNSKSKNSQKKNNKKQLKCLLSDCSSSDSEDLNNDSSSSSSCASEDDEFGSKGLEEMEKKKKHPDRMHEELWYNDPGEMNDYPLCRCSLKARRSGIKHGYYVGEEPLNSCDLWTNNADKLHHYFIAISPPTNFLVKSPTTITYDSHEFIFEGFSLLSHCPLEEIPMCQVIRFNIEYSVYCISEKIPDNFCVKELDLVYEYLFKEILELVDLNFKANGDETGCPRFHLLPRFVRKLPDSGKEVLSMNEVLSYLLNSSAPLVREEELSKLLSYSERDWLNYTDQVKGMIVTYPGKKPCSIRVDQLDREQLNDNTINFPVIVHFGIRPPQLSYAGNPLYQKALREYVKFRHLLANMPKPSYEHKRQLETKENRLQAMRMANSMKKEVTVDVSSEGFYRTGIMCDMVQHALLIPVLVRHLRFHRSLTKLEESINYKFRNRYLLQLALTHPSYRENFGTNPDHARNALTNCGVRQPQYGDKNIQYMNTHKRGINTLVNIMSRFGKKEESESKITHNERLEFLGDAVVEFLSSIHLFHLFPSLEEGGLATYRAALVQNQHLSVLAEKLELDKFVLHAHGSDLCHTFVLRHAMANCFEALMGAIFIDSGIEEADSVFSTTLFKGEPELMDIWINYKPHPLQEEEPEGDRKWIQNYPVLQKLVKFEENIGIEFRHIRLLARCFTDRSIGYNYLTLGSNQRLEFLGDTVLQLIASEYLYKYFPEHHEGHLSLLRSSLVNNRTQAVVCNDLNMTEYAIYSKLKTDLKTKDRADLLEAFLGALYIDQGLDYCRKFCDVTFFPRLQQFIVNQEWNDPKSKLQQCCLTLRSMAGGEPDIPVYKVIECKGPTNTRVYTVAVYFRNKRLSKASGHSIQWAEMLAADKALQNTQELFPQLAYQKRLIAKNIHQNKKGIRPNPHSSFNQRKSTATNNNKSDNNGGNIQSLSSTSLKACNDGKLNSNQSRNKYPDKLKRDNSSMRKSPIKNTKVYWPTMKTESKYSSSRYENRSVSVGAKSSFTSGYGNRTYKNNSIVNNTRGSHSVRNKSNIISPPRKEFSRYDSMPARCSSRRQDSEEYRHKQMISSESTDNLSRDKNCVNGCSDWSGVREKISVIAERKDNTDFS